MLQTENDLIRKDDEMENKEFIKSIAALIIKYAPLYGIKVYSPIIAQAILESAYGTSELAINAHNYFGLKYREGRCKTCIGVYHKVGSEQNADGSYVSSAMQWCRFENMEQGVIGYFDFINISNYSNLKGVTDPQEYLENIKADGYATSLKYVDNLMSVIKNWNLTDYDEKEEINMGIKIIEQIATQNPCYKAGRTINPQGGMLHSVGCPQPDPLVFVRNWANSSANVCVHAVVGKEKVWYQILPWNWRAWHCGSGSKGSGNNTLISLEMTEPASIKYTGGANWIETGDGSNTKAHVLATYANAVEFFAYICKKYGFNPEDSNVLMSHHEGNAKGIASNHGDVEHIWSRFGLSMNQFRKDVKQAMSGGTVTTVPSTPVDNNSDDTSNQSINPLNGFVTVIYDGDDRLNVRKAPSIVAEVDCIVGKGEVFTVVGISADEKWYQLKSGLFITTIPDYVSFKATEEQKQSTTGTGYYRVRTSWTDAASQIGAFKNENNAIELCKQNSGYKVFDDTGNEVYPCVKEESEPFKVRVTIPDLRIRKEAGTSYDYHKKNGNPIYTGAGVFTIVKTKEGPGASMWGLLKSYEKEEDGWISLDFVTRLN